MFGLPNSIKVNFIGSTDFLLAQAQIQSVIQGGPFGKTLNLGFPYGFTQWNNPEFGLIQSLLIYLIGNLTNVTNFGIFSLINLSSIILNTIFMYLLAMELSKKFLVHVFFILLSSLTPYALLTFGHPHVLSFFVLPGSLYFTIKIFLKRFQNKDYFYPCFERLL